MPLRLTSRRYPKLKVYIPAIKEYRQFEGGALDVADDDPALEALKEWAAARPAISIRTVTGATPEGRPVTTEIKSSAEFICEACSPAQVFGTESALNAHTAELHTNRPIVNPETGEDTPQTEPAPARVRQGPSTTRGTRSAKGSSTAKTGAKK